MAAHGWPRPAMAGHGWPWLAMAGHSWPGHDRPWPNMAGPGWSYLVNGRSMVSEGPNEHSFSILMLEARKFDRQKFGPNPKTGTHPWRPFIFVVYHLISYLVAYLLSYRISYAQRIFPCPCPFIHDKC